MPKQKKSKNLEDDKPIIPKEEEHESLDSMKEEDDPSPKKVASDDDEIPDVEKDDVLPLDPDAVPGEIDDPLSDFLPEEEGW
jgi:hypothetical protein